MANLRRHFNFSGKASMQGPEIAYMAQSDTNNRFDKCGLMKDICNCLELCCTYIQALNSLCSAGSSLAKSLFHAVQDVPAYHNISQQFLAIWEEVSKATAGASASVKTETLMMLQEVLNTLDVGNNEVDMDDTITESFQVIGTCLCSFIELQSQFSWSTWKSLSKLSKNFSSDTFRRSIQWKSNDRPFKISVNSDLNSTIKKPFAQLFCKIGIAKVNESESSQSQFFTSPSIQRDIAAYSHLSSQTGSDNNTSDSSIWSHSTTFWSSSDTAQSDPSTTAQCAAQGSNPAVVSHSDLDEVINLLSCAPAQQLTNDTTNSQESDYFPPTSSREQFYQRWPKGSTPPISRHPSPNKSWVKDSRDMMFGYDSWIWRADYTNCSGLPRDESKVMWENPELQRWNIGMCETGSSSDDASSIHGQDSEPVPSGINSKLLQQHALCPTRHRQKSGESLPGGLENSSSMMDENLWDLRSSKMSTWPLKLSAHRTNSEGELHEAQLQATYSQLHFAFS